MTYAETLDYIFQKLPMFSRMGSAAFKKDLTNTLRLCEYLGNPQNRFKTIHVGGTNGKGSVSHMLASVFQTAGYKTGLYTSPHLYDFRERIKLNGELVPEAFVVDFVERMKPLIEEIEPSFFEITVAMAFQFFAEQQVDIAVIEVGLGGKLDSTNIIQPALSVITNISWDHMNLLGNSLDEIAGEKAGIIKERIPVVIGETRPETGPVFEAVANERNAPLYWAEECFSIEQHQLRPSSLTVRLRQNSTGQIIVIESGLPGLYQLANLRTVLTAIEVLHTKGWHLQEDCVINGLKEVKERTGLGGRWEVIRDRPTVVLEVAHNQDGVKNMLAHVQQLTFRKLHLVFGMVKDKEAEKILRLLPKDATYYFTQARIPRALPADELVQKAADAGLSGNQYDDVNVALQAALVAAQPDDLILVCGSIFLVAEVDKAQYVS